MHVSELEGKNIREWDEYVINASDGHPFQLSGWRAVMQRCYGYPSWYLAAREGGQIMGVLPLFKVNSKLVGTSITSVPRGLCAEDSVAGRALLERAKEITRTVNATCLIVRGCSHCWAEEAGWCDDRIVAVRELPDDPAMLLKQLKRQIRQHIRKAEDFGVQTDVGTGNVDDFYSIYCELLHEKGVPVFGRDFLDAVVKELPGRYVIAATRLNGKVIGAILHLILRDKMFATWGGAPSRYREYRASHALWWESMKYAAENGFRYLDMGRSLRGSGAEQFKERWGSTLLASHRLHFTVGRRDTYDPLDDGSENFRYRAFTNVWRRLPSQVVCFLGPKLRRHMPFG